MSASTTGRGSSNGHYSRLTYPQVVDHFWCRAFGSIHLLFLEITLKRLITIIALSTVAGFCLSAQASGDACSVQRSNMIGAANDANRACSLIITDSAQAQCDMAIEAFNLATEDYDACMVAGP